VKGAGESNDEAGIGERGMEESDKGENGIDNNINMVVNIKLNDNA
jgi:hypothetical protein